MKITLEIEDSVIAEFEELSEFWTQDEKYNLIKPTIKETIKKFIIEKINERRVGLATSQAAVKVNTLKDKDIL